MMSKLQLKLGLAFVAVLTLVASGSLAEALGPVLDNQEDHRPLVSVTIAGDTYSAPVFEDVQMSQARRDFDRNSVGKITKKMRDLVELMVVKRKGHLSIAKSMMGVVPMAMASSKELKKLQKVDNSPNMAHNYGATMSKLLLDIIALKTDETIDDKEVKRRSDGLLLAVEEIASVSPTGLYLDWRKLKINGQPLDEFARPIIRWFRKNGYSMELKLFDGLAAVIKAVGPKDGRRRRR